MSYLIHLIPGGVEVLFDHVTLEGHTTHADLDVGVALPLPAHEAVLGDEVLGLHQMDPQDALQETQRWAEQGGRLSIVCQHGRGTA